MSKFLDALAHCILISVLLGFLSPIVYVLIEAPTARLPIVIGLASVWALSRVSRLKNE